MDQADPCTIRKALSSQWSWACWLCLLCSGCNWTCYQEPVPAAVATCREFSQQGLSALEEEDWATAEQKLRLAVRSNPEDADARKHLAEALRQRGNFLEAQEQLRAAAELHPEDAEIHLQLAHLALQQENLPAASDYLEQALEIDPKLAEAWVAQAKLAMSQRQYRDALSHSFRALRYQPDHREAKGLVASLYQNLDQPQRALAAYQEALDAYSPGNEPARLLYEQGLVCLQLGRNKQALQSLALARDRSGPDIHLWLALSQAYLAAGELEQAEQQLQRTLEFYPDHPATVALLQRVQIARRTEGTFTRYQ